MLNIALERAKKGSIAQKASFPGTSMTKAYEHFALVSVGNMFRCFGGSLLEEEFQKPRYLLLSKKHCDVLQYTSHLYCNTLSLSAQRD